MLTPDEILFRMEHAARESPNGVAPPFVSGVLRIDCEHAPDLDVVFFRVNGTGAARRTALQAIEAARARHAVGV